MASCRTRAEGAAPSLVIPDMLPLRDLVGKTPYVAPLREMIGFAAERSLECQAGALIGAGLWREEDTRDGGGRERKPS